MSAALVAAHFYLQSEAGRQFVARTIGEQVQFASGGGVTVGAVGPGLPSRIDIRDLEISDRSGRWLAAERIVIDWWPLALLTGRLHVEAIEAEGVTLARLPEPSVEKAPDDATADELVPSLPVAIRVDTITVADLRLEPPVAGRDVSARIDGRLAVDHSAAVRAAIHVVRTDDVAGFISLGASHDPSDSYLAVTVEVEEDAGGILAALAGLEPEAAVGLRLEGEGPINDWHGKLNADVRDLVSLEAELTLSRDQAWHARVKGELGVARTVPKAIDPLTRQPVDFDFGADIGDDAIVGRVTVSAAGIAIKGDGQFDRPHNRIEAELTGTITDERSARVWMEPSRVDSAEVRLSIRGPVKGPTADLDLRVRGLRHKGVEMGDIVVDGSVAPSPAADTVSILDIEATARATGIKADDADLGRVLGDAVTLEIEGSVDPEKETFHIVAANVIAAAARADVSGQGALSGEDLDLGLAVVVDDLSRFAAGEDPGLDGRLEAKLTLLRSAPAPDLKGRLTVDLTAPSVGAPVADALLGSGVTVQADLTVVGDDGLTVDVLTLRSDHVEGLGRASVSDAFSRVEASLHLEVPSLAPLAQAAETPLEGSLALDVIAEGAVADPEGSVTLTIRDANLAGTAVPRLVATLTGSRLASEPTGTVSVEGETDLTPLTVRSKFRLDAEERLVISDLAGQIAGVDISGNLEVPLSDGPLAGEVVAKLSEAAAGQPGLRLSGRGDVAVAFDAEQSAQRLQVRGQVARLRVVVPAQVDLRAATLQVQARLMDPFGSLSGDARLRATQITVDDLALTAFEASASGSLRSLNIEARGATAADTLSVAGTLTSSAGDTSLALTQIAGRVQSQDVRLERPARVRFGDDSFAVDDLALAVGPARLALEAAQRPGTVEGRLDWSSVPFALVWPETPVPGVVEGSLQITTEGRQLAGRMQARAETTPGDPGTISAVPPLSAVADAAWRGGVVQGELRLAGVGANDLVARGRVPLSVNADTLAASFSERSPIDASVRWQGDVAALSEALPLSEHRLRGDGRIALDVDGTVAAPRIAGEVSLNDALYEHLVFGTLVRALTLRGSATPDGAYRLTLSGQDAGFGSVTADARAVLRDADQSRIEAVATLSRMTVVRRDDVTAVASGRIDYGPVGRANQVRGRVQVDEAEIKLIDRLPPSVVDLEVIEIGGGRTAAPPPPPPEGPERPTTLDITIDLPNRVFVRGRGLESEWSGRLTITGSIDEPSLVGELRLIRGDLALAGKQFVLTTGVIAFDGGSDIDPRLNIVAEVTTSGITGVISVAGRASQPQISLSSRPGLPEAEILPRVLFGKRTDQLGPGEAVQLALALDTLAGGESVSGGFLGQAQDAVGLDVLTVESDPGGGAGPSLRAGRYIGDRIYIEARQGTTSGTTRYRGELKLTPKLSVESEVGTGGESDEPTNYFGLKWEYRY